MLESVIHTCACSACVAQDNNATQALHHQINLFLSRLDEQQRRWYAALKSMRIGRGLPGRTRAGAPCRSTGALRYVRRAQRCKGLCPVAGATAGMRVGGLRPVALGRRPTNLNKRRLRDMKRSIAKKRMHTGLHEHYRAEVIGMRLMVI